MRQYLLCKSSILPLSITIRERKNNLQLGSQGDHKYCQSRQPQLCKYKIQYLHVHIESTQTTKCCFFRAQTYSNIIFIVVICVLYLVEINQTVKYKFRTISLCHICVLERNWCEFSQKFDVEYFTEISDFIWHWL